MLTGPSTVASATRVISDGGEAPAVAEPAGEPGVGGVERDGEQDGPDHDRHEGPDELQRPPGEEAEEGEADDEVGGAASSCSFRRRGSAHR